jgi:hypothetical protein
VNAAPARLYEAEDLRQAVVVGIVADVHARWLLFAQAYIGARGAAQDVIGAVVAAAHSLPGRPVGRQPSPGARRARWSSVLMGGSNLARVAQAV